MLVVELYLHSLMIKWQGLFFTNLSGDKTAKKTIKSDDFDKKIIGNGFVVIFEQCKFYK